MGQYYLVVNLTKKEYIYPHVFGDGLKLMEIGCSGMATMLGVTLLLRQSTGNGGGDFNPDPTMFEWYREEKAKLRGLRGQKRADQKQTIEYIEKWYGADSWTEHMEAHVNEYLGRWAGDQITIVGDYDDSKLYQIAQGNCHEDGTKVTDDEEIEGYKDISYEVLELMLMDRYVLQYFKENKPFMIDRAPKHIQKILGYEEK